MAKLVILAFTLLALLVLSKASTITIDQEENPTGSQSCRKPVQWEEELLHCHMDISHAQIMSPYEELPRMVTNQQQQDKRPHLRQCCQQLRRMDEPCRCEGIRQILREIQGRGAFRADEMQHVVRRARYLPQSCNLSPQECQT